MNPWFFDKGFGPVFRGKFARALKWVPGVVLILSLLYFLLFRKKNARVVDIVTSGQSDQSKPKKISEIEISPYTADAYLKVPSVGEGGRWYDWAEWILLWASSSWRKILLSRRMAEKVLRWRNHLLRFNEHERNLIWSPEDSRKRLDVPSDEHVDMPAIWVVELFPPSGYKELERIILKNAWDRNFLSIFSHRKSNIQLLERMRSGESWSGWTLASIADTDAKFISPNAVRERLPGSFSAIEIHGVRIGSGLTALVAHFQLSESAAKELDEVWHKEHNPHLIWVQGAPLAENRQWAAFRVTQQARRRFHDEARRWMAKKCPGFFSGNGISQPLADLLLLENYDPCSSDYDRAFQDPLRALGITGHHYHIRNNEVPKLLLLSVEDMCPGVYRENTQGFWGNKSSIASCISHLDAYGSDSEFAIANYFDRSLANFLAAQSVSAYVSSLESNYAKARDLATVRHGKFKAKELRRLRSQFLVFSMDLVSSASGLEEFWSGSWHEIEEARFTFDLSPHLLKADEEHGRKRFSQVDVNEKMREQQKKKFAQLMSEDVAHRDILSSVASIGSSVDSYALGRIALLVAGASLVVALATLALANIGCSSILYYFFPEWVSGFACEDSR
ncbi:hypothetical protein ACFVWN_13270 [Nocardiopsis flavescens]|uniref:hypothetical protein n=1 Tax=Nocardiopsis flavescens TaxID=758803 RepID=UPI003660A868